MRYLVVGAKVRCYDEDVSATLDRLGLFDDEEQAQACAESNNWEYYTEIFEV